MHTGWFLGYNHVKPNLFKQWEGARPPKKAKEFFFNKLHTHKEAVDILDLVRKELINKFQSRINIFGHFNA